MWGTTTKLLIILQTQKRRLVAGFLEAFGVFGDLEGVDAFLDVAVHEDGEIVHAPVYAVVCDAALRIVVGADLGGAVAGGYHSLALGGNTVEILLVLHVVEAGTELLHGTVKVLELGALLLALDHDARRDVGQAHGGIGRVDALAAGAGRAEEVLADIVGIELDIEFSRFGENSHGSG